MGKYWSHSKESKHKISRAATKRYVRRRILVRCIKCEKEFYTTIARKEGGRGKYCSKKCMYSDKKGKTTKNSGQFKKGQKPKNYIGNKVTCEKCGKEFEAAPCFNRKFCSRKCEHLDKIGKDGYWKRKKRPNISGKNNSNWKGGITKENSKQRQSVEYKKWRDSVFERDNYTCQDCGKHGCYIEAHHIKSFADYIDLRYVIDNGITYCKKCHGKNDKYRQRTL